MKNKVVGVRIELRHIRPKIWRRVVVPVTTTLDTVHEIIQVAFGWWNYHLWEFTIKGEFYGMPQLEDSIWGRKIHEASDFTLETFINRGIKRFLYTYDFGDNWEHDIIFGVVREVEESASYPVLVGGARCGPPEDVGGVFGYDGYCETLLDPEHEEHDDNLQWRGEYSPDKFDAEFVRQELKKIII